MNLPRSAAAALIMGACTTTEPRMDCKEVETHVGSFFEESDLLPRTDFNEQIIQVALGVTNPENWLEINASNANEACMSNPVNLDFYPGQFTSSENANIYYQPPHLNSAQGPFFTWTQVLPLDERLNPTGAVIKATFWRQDEKGDFTIQIPHEDMALSGRELKEDTESMEVWQVIENNNAESHF